MKTPKISSRYQKNPHAIIHDLLCIGDPDEMLVILRAFEQAIGTLKKSERYQGNDFFIQLQRYWSQHKAGWKMYLPCIAGDDDVRELDISLRIDSLGSALKNFSSIEKTQSDTIDEKAQKYASQ
jgi:hypothetical protein